MKKSNNIIVNKKAIPIASIILLIFSVVVLGSTIFKIVSTSDYIKTTAYVNDTYVKEENYTDNDGYSKTSKNYHTILVYKDKNNKDYTADEVYMILHPKKKSYITIYYNPNNPYELRPQMLPYYIIDVFDIIFILLSETIE